MVVLIPPPGPYHPPRYQPPPYPQSELNEVAATRTTLVIAHRLSTIVDASQIVVMDRGRVVERGTHEELLDRRGQYARLWALQQRRCRARSGVGSAALDPTYGLRGQILRCAQDDKGRGWCWSLDTPAGAGTRDERGAVLFM